MLKKSLYAAAALMLVAFVASLVEYAICVSRRNSRVEQQVLTTTEELRTEVDEILSRIVREADRLARLFGSNDYSKEEVERIIRESSLLVEEIQGVTAAYEPYAFSSESRLYSPYYNKGTKEFLYVGKKYDYTDASDEAADWYTQVRDEGAKWVEPYFAKGALDWYVDYGVPFHYQSGPKRGEVRGTVTLSFVCSGFKELIHSLSLGKTGYGIITSPNGQFLAHPIDEYVGVKNLKELAESTSNGRLAKAYDELLLGNQGVARYRDEALNDHRLFSYDQIPTSGWGIGLLFFESDLLLDRAAMHRRYIHLALLLSLVFVCLLAIQYNKDYLDEGEIWRLSLVSSVLLLANIVLIGVLRHRGDQVDDLRGSPPIIDMSSLSTFVNQQNTRARELHVEASTVVPTGMFIRRMDFADSYNLNVSGMVWQKYPSSFATDSNLGFRFPQISPFAESSYVEEAYRQEVAAKEGEEGYLLIGWDFRVTLRLNLQYADFPFDKREINIEIVPLDRADRMLLVPDLASYTYTNPSKKCGLSDSIEMSGSEVVQTYFNFTTEDFRSDFGYGIKGLFEEVPVLHFNIQLRRILLNAFVTYLIPIVVTLVMMFLLIYACRKTTERQGIIESMAAFCFVLIFSHIDLRREIVTADLVYIEYFYFITYAMVMLSTFNLITYTLDKSPVFDFNENQVFKAMFFPAFLLAVLVVTLVKFY